MAYSRYTPSYSFGGPLTHAIKWIMVACVAVFILQQLSFLQGVFTYLALIPALFVRGCVWQPFTYIFMHGGVFHLGINMLMLYMFGGELERFWGGRKFFFYFTLTGIGGGVTILLASLIWPIGPVIGASGAIFGILVAWALLFPNRQAMIFPFPVMIRARYFAMIFIGIELLIVWSWTGNVFGAMAHLGGALTGYLYLEKLRGMPRFRGAYRRWRNRRIAKKFRVVVNENFFDPNDDDDRRHMVN